MSRRHPDAPPSIDGDPVVEVEEAREPLTPEEVRQARQQDTVRSGAPAGESGTPAPDVVYDLVSIQYHALKGAQVYDKYLEDARRHPEVADFFRQVKEEDARRAERAHDLLVPLTRQGLGGV